MYGFIVYKNVLINTVSYSISQSFEHLLLKRVCIIIISIMYGNVPITSYYDWWRLQMSGRTEQVPLALWGFSLHLKTGL